MVLHCPYSNQYIGWDQGNHNLYNKPIADLTNDPLMVDHKDGVGQ